VSVEKEPVFVESEKLRPSMSLQAASQFAERFIPVLNGLLGMRFQAFRGLKIEGIVGVADNDRRIGANWTTIQVSGASDVAIAHAYLKDGGPSVRTEYLLAVTDPSVAEVLLYFGRGGEPFFDLYKAFEVMFHSMGGQQELVDRNIADSVECERFTRSANDPAISGVLARHSLKHSTPIANPMDQHEARRFVRATFHRWAAYLASQPQTSP
jgi:hypothetical protein